MKVALDSNVLIYAEDMHDRARRDRALAVVMALSADQVVLPAHVHYELLAFLVRKAKLPKAEAVNRVEAWRDGFPQGQDTTAPVLTAAHGLVRDHQFQVGDAIVLASAAEAGCGLLLSEDMQHGFTWRGVTVLDPFRDPPHPLLAGMLASAPPLL